MATKTVSMSPEGICSYQNDLVRAGQYLNLGHMRTVAVGPSADYTPPPDDPYINGFGERPQRNARGRMLDLSGQWLPIGQAQDDKSMVLCLAPMIRRDGFVGLPDLADPRWRAENWTEEEVTGKVERDPEKDRPRFIPQRLQDRTSVKLAGTNFLVFQPVERITYQPEDLKGGHGFQPAEWKIDFRPEIGGKHCALLVDEKTGECHFLGGIAIFGGDSRG